LEQNNFSFFKERGNYMPLIRPDLSQVDPVVVAYINSLEAEIERLQHPTKRSRPILEPEEIIEIPPTVLEPNEPPTTINLITGTASGIIKRTPRHLYARQRRSGMGIFDLDSPDDEPPTILSLVDQTDNLLIFTNLARAFRLPASVISEMPVRARGESISSRLNLQPDEHLVSILPDRAQGYISLLSQRGMIRLLRHHVFGEHMKPGTSMFDPRAFGPLVGTCWTPGEGDLLIATRQGRAIRFAEKSVQPLGGSGIRLAEGDSAVAITPVRDDSQVFLLGADGKGTIRLMSSFTPNKAPGAGGKIAMATDHLIAALAVEEEDDIFIISKLGKIIRFRADEVPPKDGVVQGVICMSLRGDECTTVAVNSTVRSF
jgi:DNA gyrase subunit A